MIESTGLTKSFGDIMAVNNVDMTIHEGTAFGLLGTNGAGKSTLLRMIAGILRQNSGSLTLDGSNIYENPAAKQQLFYIADNQYFFANTTPAEQGVFYSTHYPAFDKEGFSKLLKAFDLPAQRKVNTFSKGMKKQLSLLAGICANTTYLLCDETFDGLDPVMRQAVKSLMADAMAGRGLTPVIASHNLRELEDICDHVGLLHKGGLLLLIHCLNSNNTSNRSRCSSTNRPCRRSCSFDNLNWVQNSTSFQTRIFHGFLHLWSFLHCQKCRSNDSGTCQPGCNQRTSFSNVNSHD